MNFKQVCQALKIINKKVFISGLLLFWVGLLSIWMLQDYTVLHLLIPIVCGGGAAALIIASVDIKEEKR